MPSESSYDTRPAAGLPPGGLSAKFASIPFAAQGKTWDSLWQDSLTPWDPDPNRGPSYALNELLSSQAHLFQGSDSNAAAASKGSERRRKTALVPACGRGYDVLLLSAFGYDSYGLEISQTAIEKAKEVEEDVKMQKLEDMAMYEAKAGVESKGKVKWILGDFFEDAFLTQTDGVEKFDLIFDFTFFCAIPPSQRPAWAQRMSKLLAPDGKLICLEFPRNKPYTAPGPPFRSASEAYVAHLGHPGASIEYSSEGDPLDEHLVATEGALGRISWTTPSKTFSLGTAPDGTVTDKISVWAHLELKR